MATRRNLCPNPACANNTAGWGGGATPTRTTVTGFGRTTAAHYTSGTYQIPAAAASGSITPGQTYTISVYLRSNVFNQNNRTLYLEWLNASGNPTGTAATATFSLTTGVVARASATGTAPAGAAACWIVVDGINASLSSLDVTMALIEEGTLGDYFDGDSAGASWDGTPGNSSSTLPDEGVTGVLAATLPAISGQASGAVTAVGQLDADLPALQGSIDAAATARGTVVASLPALAGAIDGTVTVAGQLDGTLAPLTGSLTATATAAGQLDGILPALGGTLTAAATIHGALAGALPALSGTLAAAASVEAVLDGVLPAVTGSAQATATVRGNLNGVLAAVEGAFDGTTETAGGILAGVLPPLDGAFTAAATARGLLAAALPPLSSDLTGRARTHGLLAATLAPVEGALQGEVVQPSGVLDGRLPALTGALTGTSAGTALPPVNPRVGTPRLAWPTGTPTVRSWPVAAARTTWPPVRPPTLGEE